MYLLIAGISSISWKRISSAKVPNKVKRFIWRVAQYNSLPNHKEMSKNCRSCKNTCESSLHTLITCETSQSVWTLSGLKVNLNFPSDVSIKNWLGFHITELEEQEIDLFLCTLWAIWRARKILVHEGRFLSHEEVFKLAKAMVNSFKTTRSIPSCISSPIWIRPPLGYLKINVHATFDERSLSSALGIVVRNDFGQFVIAKTLKKERVENETRAELLALREGAKFAFEYGFERVILEGDLVKTMDLVRSGKPNLSKKGRIVEDIRCYLNGIPHSLFVSCFFSANQVAHILAIWSKYQSKESCVNFVSCPDFIKQSLALDSRLLV